MISNPKHGWCKFELGNFKGTPSYLTDVPLDILDGLINYFRVGYSVISFDEEGSSFILILERYNSNIFLIEEDEKPILHTYNDLTIIGLVREVILDIEKDLDKWSDFITSDSIEDIQQHKEDIIQRLSVLKELSKINGLERLG